MGLGLGLGLGWGVWAGLSLRVRVGVRARIRAEVRGPRMACRFVADSKCARPTSTVLPLARSSSLVSMMKARNHDSRFFSLASFSYFSMVRASTCPVR